MQSVQSHSEGSVASSHSPANLYVCMYVCECLYVHVCLHVCMHVYIHVHTCGYMYVWICHINGYKRTPHINIDLNLEHQCIAKQGTCF